MSIRETMNRHPAMAAGIMVPVILLAAGILIYWQMPEKPPKQQTQAYFTVDDGKTWFVDSVNKIAPFSKDGKEAVVAGVFRCGSSEPFVGYLERLAPDAKKRVDEIQVAGVNQGNAPEYGRLRATGMQRKKPGDSNWVKFTDNEVYTAMQKVTCKDGQPASEVYPPIP